MRRLLPFMRLATVALAALASTGCIGAGETADDEPSSIDEREEELVLHVDTFTIRHGTLHVAARMDNGSPDVSLSLPPPCEPKEIGHGLATRTSFVWRLTAHDMARALECDVLVRAQTKDEDGRRVRRTAKLPFSILLASDDEPIARVVQQVTDGDSTRLAFSTATRATRLHASGGVFGAEPSDEDDDEGAGRFRSYFVVPNDDLARAVLTQRPLTVLGVSVFATASIGEVPLDLELADEPSPPDES